MKNRRVFSLPSTVAEMDWLTQRSGAKQQALLSSKIETPNKTASVQEPHCCKELFSSQEQPYSLPHYVSAIGSRGHHHVSGAEEWGRDSWGVKTTALKKSLVQKQSCCLSKHLDKTVLWNGHLRSLNSNNIFTTQYKFFRTPDFMTHASQCLWFTAFAVLIPPLSACRKEDREEPVEKSGPRSKFS